MYYVAYNPFLANALVGVSEHGFTNLPEGIAVEQIDEDLPDLTKVEWSEGSLRFNRKESINRYLTVTEFMRRFSMTERLAIRGLERDGDLIIVDAMSLMAGTKEGVNLDDPDVYATLQYLAYAKNVILPDRIQEILS